MDVVEEEAAAGGAERVEGREPRLRVDEAHAAARSVRHRAHDRVRARVGAKAQRVEVARRREVRAGRSVLAGGDLAAAEAVGGVGVLGVEAEGLGQPSDRVGATALRLEPHALVMERLPARPVPKSRAVLRREGRAAAEVDGHGAQHDRHAPARGHGQRVGEVRVVVAVRALERGIAPAHLPLEEHLHPVPGPRRVVPS